MGVNDIDLLPDKPVVLCAFHHTKRNHFLGSYLLPSLNSQAQNHPSLILENQNQGDLPLSAIMRALLRVPTPISVVIELNDTNKFQGHYPHLVHENTQNDHALMKYRNLIPGSDKSIFIKIIFAIFNIAIF